MRKFLVFAVLAVLALLAPAAAQAHNVTGGSAVCKDGKLVVTVNLANFNDYDKKFGIKYVVKVDGKAFPARFTARPDFHGSSHVETLVYPAPQDAARHTVTVEVSWNTGRGVITRTVENCCPPPPVCCAPGLPGPQGSAGPPGNTTTDQTVVERTVVRVEERTCTSHRVYRFLVKRRVRLEADNRLRLVTAVRAHENRFTVNVRKVRRGGHRRYLVTVRPPAAGIKASRGQVFNTSVGVRLKGKGKRWFSLGERRRLCMPEDGALNAPSASGPARG